MTEAIENHSHFTTSKLDLETLKLICHAFDIRHLEELGTEVSTLIQEYYLCDWGNADMLKEIQGKCEKISPNTEKQKQAVGQLLQNVIFRINGTLRNS